MRLESEVRNVPIIGIDLGTTYSLVSCYVDNECIIIPNAEGERLTPSVVSVFENGDVIVGRAAKERFTTYPKVTAAAFKRYMGTNKKYSLGKYSFTPTELSSFIIKSLKADAEAFLKCKISEAVISVPAYFNDEQRRATKYAGELAGLRVERLINEPTAAAVAYGLHQEEEERKFLVFDLGGGTFDISILDLFGELMEVRAVAGDNFLGGEDFDECIINCFLERFNLKTDSFDLKILNTIKKQAEKCKIILSENDEAEMNCIINNKSYSLSITNEELESMTSKLLLRLKKPILRALRDSSISYDDIDDIILVGGSTKMPIIRSFNAKAFGRLPLCHLNPDEVVALGAGVYAAMKERNENLRENVLTDVCPYTLGVDIAVDNGYGELEPGRFLPIIERNTTIPYSKVEKLYNAYDFQNKICVGIYQGESRLVENNIKLGEVVINIPSALKGQSAIDVRFTYDINGILEVEVISIETGEKKRQVLINSSTKMTGEQIENRLKELEKIKIHPREDSKNQYLIAKGERLYEETLSDLRYRIANALENFESVLNRQNPAEIKCEAERFEEFLNNIEDAEI